MRSQGTTMVAMVRMAGLGLVMLAAVASRSEAQYGFYRFPLPGGASGIATGYPGSYTVGTYTPYYTTGYYSGFTHVPGYTGSPGYYQNMPYYPSTAGAMMVPNYYRNFGGFVYPNTAGYGAVGYGGFGYPSFGPYLQYYGVSPAYGFWSPLPW